MPLPLKPGTLRCLSRWTSYIWKDVFFQPGIYLLATAVSPRRLLLEEVSRDADSALCLSRLYLFFFFLRDFHLLLLESQVHGSPPLQAESCFMVEHPWRAGCGTGSRGGLREEGPGRLGTCGRAPGPPLRATLS